MGWKSYLFYNNDDFYGHSFEVVINKNGIGIVLNFILESK